MIMRKGMSGEWSYGVAQAINLTVR